MCLENFDPKDLENQVMPCSEENSEIPNQEESGEGDGTTSGGDNNGGNNGGGNGNGNGNGSGNGNGNGTIPPDPFWGIGGFSLDKGNGND